jgi:hypothetical protein
MMKDEVVYLLFFTLYFLLYIFCHLIIPAALSKIPSTYCHQGEISSFFFLEIRRYDRNKEENINKKRNIQQQQ